MSSAALDGRLDFGAGRLARAAWLVGVVLLTAGAVTFGRVHHDSRVTVTLILCALATAPLAGAVRWPLPSLVLVVAANSVFVVWGQRAWPPTAVLGWLVALAAAPLLLRRAPAVLLLVASEVAVLLGAVMPGSINPRPWDAPITEALAVLLVWGAGETVRSRREARTQQRLAAAELRAAREHEAVARGRAEIARELHDVVAHHVSLIAVRAATTRYQLDDVPPAAAAVFDEIAARARTALDELRAVLGVLRDPDAASPHAPQPGLADLPGLVDRMRGDGMRIAVDIDGDLSRATPSDAVQLCCYRVVQESLTNAARHASGTTVDVAVRYHAGSVEALIANPLASDCDVPAQPGYGLLGKRERVAALGGTLEVNVDDGTFRVAALIPTAAGD